MIPVIERAKTVRAFERAATVIGENFIYEIQMILVASCYDELSINIPDFYVNVFTNSRHWIISWAV
jgi:hypothetical protein